MVLLIGAFVAIGISITSSTESNMSADAAADIEEDTAKDGKNVGDSGGKEAAEALIDQTVSRDEIEASVGKWDKFEMDGNGCERGVYAGLFYYEDFTLYSRTYDKGDTFHVMSVNE